MSTLLRPMLAVVLFACGPTPRAGDDDPGADAETDNPAVELCGNGVDDDHDGGIDNGCACSPGATQPCFAGDPSTVGHGACKAGVQTCLGDGEFGAWSECADAVGPTDEVCNNLDDNCNGILDDLPSGSHECVIVDVMVNIDGDCVTASCPMQAPYPISCNIMMSGSDSRGCVASKPMNSSVYFQEGDKCGVGHVSGKLTCASVPGAALNAMSCPINKNQKFYPAMPSGCPDT